MRTSALFGAKTSEFAKFMVRPHGQGESSQCGQEETGESFAILCKRPLWMAVKQILYNLAVFAQVN